MHLILVLLAQVITHVIFLRYEVVLRGFSRQSCLSDSLQLPTISLQVCEVTNYLSKLNLHDFVNDPLCFIDALHYVVSANLLDVVKAVELQSLLDFRTQLVVV